MLRGLLSGLIWGVVVAAVGLAVVSRAVPERDLALPVPEAGGVAVPAGSAFNAERPDEAPVLPQTEGRPAAAPVAMATPSGAGDTPATDTAPAAPPETGTIDAALATPGVGDAPAVAAPVDAAPETATPSASAGADLVLFAPDDAPDPAAPVEAPETGPAEGAMDEPAGGEAAGVVTGEAVDTAPEGVLAQPNQPALERAPAGGDPAETPAAGGMVKAPDTPAPGETPQLDEGEDVALAPRAEVAVPSAPALDAAPSGDDPAAAPAAGGSVTPPDAPDPGETPRLDQGEDVALAPWAEVATPSAPAPDPAPDVSAVPDAPAPREIPDSSGMPGSPAGIGLNAPEIGVLSPGIDTETLPRIGAAEPDGEAEMTDAPALERYAVAFEPEGSNPLVAVVLLDEGAVADAASLAGFPVPLTVAIDPTRDGVAARMAALRAAGLEVAVLTPLPPRAAPADVEVAFGGYLQAVPEAVAVMDVADVVLQESRPRAAQIVGILADTGHGMITYERGLNAALQIAAGRGVKAATVFREFDDGDRDGAGIKRFLDQGAFRAGQAGPVIMVGRLRPETLTAIAEWALGTRAATVQLAPVSAVLQKR